MNKHGSCSTYSGSSDMNLRQSADTMAIRRRANPYKEQILHLFAGGRYLAMLTECRPHGKKDISPSKE
ncbi:hypothetical protein PGTUg99_020714 [Puccinia graminis f. sp. tritici]|uniref:Uncharacterized protein n=1 Tax=Puccinia graminis f. sp. tritici TaxID=56615 RepID=A0A5B0RM35_PUCGR|nr:hypothetical protein PGTUg99_020714 [Puccinia graminis f. sp. tritici]